MDNLTASILEYITKKDTDYAIMIDGDWGSGKTYYWDNIVKTQIENVKVGGKNYKTIYISLYGVASLDEISKNIFVQSYTQKYGWFRKLRKNKVINKIPEIGKIALNGAGLLGLSVGDINIDFSKLTSFGNIVLCFDDLERANIEVSEVLGYINNFVEHDHIKTIIIANEREISDKLIKQNFEAKAMTAITLLDKRNAFNENNDVFMSNKKNVRVSPEIIMETIRDTFESSNEYKRIKEKLVGKTFLYKPNCENIIDSLIENRDKKLYEFLMTNHKLIIDTFNFSNTGNYRILRQALNDFDSMFSEINKHYLSVSNIIMQTLLIFTLALSLETKSGRLDPNIFRSIKSSLQYQSEVYEMMMTRKKNDSEIVNFNNKYFGGVFFRKVFFKFAEVYISTGILDKELMYNEIDSLISEADTNNIPHYKKLFYNPYWELSDSEFDKSLEQTYLDIKNGDIYFVCYFRGYVTFVLMERQGLLKEYMLDFKQVFLDGLELAKNKNRASKDLSMEFLVSDDGSLLEDETLNTIKSRIIEINKQIREEENKVEIEGLFSVLKQDVIEFERIVKKRFYISPIFYCYDVSEILNIILNMQNGEIVYFRNFIKDRYRINNENLREDFHNLRSLKRQLDKHTNNKPNTLSISNIRELSKTINEICSEH
ncbi:P-loop NTPase fold protein [Clostridium sp. BSD9I1]|uniref:P-loop NTPase fold protein n=1 Tax=Clostridium sp. BSD9I1 TaxID=2003589 RepID=UPI001646C724|nr:P-loop NTPase fold protein [Clostridium sp. BSD9I1]